MKENTEQRDMTVIENGLYEKGFCRIAGVDEAGRGPLAGPVCAAAVILPRGISMEGVDDSKKLSEKKREALFDIICDTAVAYAIEFIEPEVIDSINIRQATSLAMHKAVKKLEPAADCVIVDGNDNIPFDIPYEYVIKGDARSQSIAAASILAKVSRDRLMRNLDKNYPEYGFAKHKGYGTKAHIEAIREYGVSDIHRRTFMTDKVLGKK